MSIHSKRAGWAFPIVSGIVATLAAAWTIAHGLGTARAAGGSTPIQVTLNINASDPNGQPLAYRWRSSDGQIVDVNAPTTTWTLPDGPGIHFAYVLVSNGRGGYTEQRVVVNTDTIGTLLQAHPQVTLQAPPASTPVGETYRRFTFRPDAFAFAQDDGSTLRFPAVGVVRSDLKEQLVFRGMTPVLSPPVTMNIFCGVSPTGPFDLCDEISPDSGIPTPPTNLPPNTAVTDTHFRVTAIAPGDVLTVDGQVLLADGSVCGTQNEFFDVESTATIEVRDETNALAAGPFRVNAYGFFEIDYPNAVVTPSFVIRCENAPALQVSSASNVVTNIPSTGRPAVSLLTARLGDGTLVGQFPPPGPPPASQPSDAIAESDKFLAYKGLDSRISACLYYKAVGAVKACDRSGNLISPVRFDDWQRAVLIGPYALPGFTEYVATYINKADLNLTRNHHSISYGPSHTAAYVCNHLGPKVLDPTQIEIDQVIADAVNGRNLVACVAMDYISAPGVNGGLPFVRFLIFGPSGELLPSVNLDGRREKFVPGTCVVCHGGDHYTARFPETGTGPANIGAHFLPYDVGNFLFSSQPGLREVDQEAAIHALNVNVLNAGPTVAAQELIAGWYANGTFDKDYVPVSWQGRGQLATDFYLKVIGTSCRGCHVNMAEGFNWDHYDNVNQTYYRSTDIYGLYASIGECDPANPNFRMHSMPNSAVTFNRFWQTAGTAEDLPKLYDDFMAALTGGGDDPINLTCKPTRP
jgi:hypothetical protein